MKTVWMIEDGCYSDYHIVGVYSTKKNAEFIQHRIGGDIKERQLNPGIAQLHYGLNLYQVLMARNGNIEAIEQRDMDHYNLEDKVTMWLWERTKAPAYKGKNICDVLHATVWAKDIKHAVKIVNEKRTQFIAEGKWS